ncbi:MAG: hypothetical protein K0S86_1972 [Geminicoccaceae bacterium]|nr:hypothetical protein [Geminicoccaceae bacterium]
MRLRTIEQPHRVRPRVRLQSPARPARTVQRRSLRIITTGTEVDSTLDARRLALRPQSSSGAQHVSRPMTRTLQL